MPGPEAGAVAALLAASPRGRALDQDAREYLTGAVIGAVAAGESADDLTDLLESLLDGAAVAPASSSVEPFDVVGALVALAGVSTASITPTTTSPSDSTIVTKNVDGGDDDDDDDGNGDDGALKAAAPEVQAAPVRAVSVAELAATDESSLGRSIRAQLGDASTTEDVEQGAATTSASATRGKGKTDSSVEETATKGVEADAAGVAAPSHGSEPTGTLSTTTTTTSASPPSSPPAASARRGGGRRRKSRRGKAAQAKAAASAARRAGRDSGEGSDAAAAAPVVGPRTHAEVRAAAQGQGLDRRFDGALVPDAPTAGSLSTNPFNRSHGVAIMRVHEDDGITTTGAADRIDPHARKRNIHISNLSIAVQGAELIDSSELRLDRGERYALTGVNGSGKSTLMRRMAGGVIGGWPQGLRTLLVDQECTGSETASAVDTVLAADTERADLLLEQRRLLRASNGAAASGGAADGAAAATAGEEEGDAGEDLGRLTAVMERLEQIEADSAPERAVSVLSALGFSDAQMTMPTSALSGGWRMRVSLASALFARPDVLLLDEPTNHLDLEGQLWLEEYLCDERMAETMVVLVSHDRAFLDAVATNVIHLQSRRLSYYPGDFSTFERVRSDRRTFLAHAQANIEKHRAHQAAVADKMRTQAARAKGGDDRRTRQIASRKKKMGRMGLEKTLDGKKFNAQKHGIRLGAANSNTGGWDAQGKRSAASIMQAEDPAVKFSFPAPDAAAIHDFGSTPVVQLRQACIAYEGAARDTLSGVEFDVSASSRIALVGKNGEGKSTLMNALYQACCDRGSAVNNNNNNNNNAAAATASSASDTDSLAASLRVTSRRDDVDDHDAITINHHKLRAAYFTQHHVDAMDLDKTPLEHLRMALPGHPDQALRAQLGAFGIDGRTLCNRQLRLLSGGQKSRVVLAALTLSKPNMLLLDEPSNHLDVESIDGLVRGLQAFTGPIVLISHNRHLVTELCTEIQVVDAGRVQPFDGDFDSYCAELRGM